MNVRRMVADVGDAGNVVLVILNGQKHVRCSDELKLRVSKSHSERYLAVGNRIGVFFFGVRVTFEVKSIAPRHRRERGVENVEPGDGITENASGFYKITNETKWKLCRLVRFPYFTFCPSR